MESYSNLNILANVFENFRKMFLRNCHFDHLKLLSAPGMLWQAAIKNTEVELKLLTDIDILLMV